MKIKLHYEEKGTGQPMVLLHGNGEDSSYFKNQIEYFSKKYRVIAVDTRGHGKSERGTAPFTLRQFARDLKSFLDEMGQRRGKYRPDFYDSPPPVCGQADLKRRQSESAGNEGRRL